ncbi:hypothetical protein F4813DRAFT_384629 [Daldinia decipiens]|uniref:uncharacterized protein n=1 Tax=Daldinia decipiens TaxID=326647 RepID=UPI0020C25CD1|nr:uncharacterized protein F4813DRAFT_384629 [Daldinia decipiens]KAI1663063.1 hypothetical protein F4813DRAFT_384629 [Daldinia decipiens]
MEPKNILATILLSSGVQSLVLPDGTLQLAPLDAHASEWGPDLASAYRREEPKSKPEKPSQYNMKRSRGGSKKLRNN